MNKKKLYQIRNRTSYSEFKRLYEYLKGNPTPEEILVKFWGVIDSHKGFHFWF